MKRYLTLLGLLALLGAGALAAPLRVGGFVVAPIITAEADGRMGGALRAYMEQEIERRAGVALSWTEPTSYGRALEHLKQGRIDILLLNSQNADSPDAAAFPWTFLRTHPQLAMRKGGAMTVQSLRQLDGMQIGWVAGSRLIDELEGLPIRWQLLATPNWQVLNLRKLQAGRIDAVFFQNEFSPRYLARRERIDIDLVRLPVAPRNFLMYYNVHADPVQIERFNRAAAAAFAGEQFRVYLEQYMEKYPQRQEDGAAPLH